MTITVPADCTYDPKRTCNKLFMKFEDTQVDICIGEKSADNPKKIGCISGTLGGSIVIGDEETGEEWRIKPMDLWNAYVEAKGQKEDV